MAGRKLNSYIGNVLATINNEAVYSDDELAEIENQTVNQFIAEMKGAVATLEQLVAEDPEMGDVDFCEFIQNFLEYMNSEEFQKGEEKG